MANKLGQLNCDADRKNTGYGDCVEDWKMMAGAFIYDSPRTFTAEEIATLQDTLTADAIADTKSARAFPVHNFVDGVDNTEDIVIQTFGYGSKIVVRDGDNDWTFTFTDGGNCLAQSLRSHNGKGHVLFYDKEGKILGYKKGGLLTTIPTQFIHTAAWKLATGSTVAGYMIRFVFLSKYANELRGLVKAEFDLAEIAGVKDLEIVVNDINEGTGLVNVTIQTACGSENVYDLFSAQLNNIARYTAVDDEGNEVTLTAMALQAADKTFNITLDAADIPDSGNIYLSGKALSVLAAAGIEGYEIPAVTIPITGS